MAAAPRNSPWSRTEPATRADPARASLETPPGGRTEASWVLVADREAELAVGRNARGARAVVWVRERLVGKDTSAGPPPSPEDVRALCTIARSRSCTFLCIFRAHFGSAHARSRREVTARAAEGRVDHPRRTSKRATVRIEQPLMEGELRHPTNLSPSSAKTILPQGSDTRYRSGDAPASRLSRGSVHLVPHAAQGHKM